MYYFVNKEKNYQICTCPVWFNLTLLVCADVHNEIEKCQLSKSLKYVSTLLPMKNNVRCEYVPWKNAWFCFLRIV